MDNHLKNDIKHSDWLTYLKNAVNVLVSTGATDTTTATSLPANSLSPYGPVAQKDRAAVS